MSSSPDCHKLLRELTDHDVAFVLAGSVAVQARGAEVGVPGDLDIIPATDEINLRKLANALEALRAKHVPATGEWIPVDDGFKWQEWEQHDPRRQEEPRKIDPQDAASFDSLFTTSFGNLDVVPVISGTYHEMVPRASMLTVHGVDGVLVMSVEDLLAHLTVPRRAKDAARVAHLRAVQRQR